MNLSKEDFLQRLYKKNSINLIFNHIDDLLLAGEFIEIDDILKDIDMKQLNISCVVGFLSITLMAKDVLKYRNNFYELVELYLKEIEPLRVEGLLKGLK